MVKLNKVNLIDDNFANIETGKITKDQITKKTELETISVLESVYNRKGNDILWIAKHHKKIIAFLKTKYNSSSLKIRLGAIANILLSIDKNKYKDLARELHLNNKAIQQDYDKEKKKQKFTENEKTNFIKFELMIDKTKEIFELWEGNMENLKYHIKTLILMLNTYLPPLRLDLIGMIITYSKPDHDKYNYLWIDNDKMFIVINNDKISTTQVILDLVDFTSENVKFISGESVKNLINISLTCVKRKYLLFAIKDISKPLAVSTYNSFLKSIFGKDVRQSIMRKSYINHYHDQRLQLNLNEKEIIAKYMRHTISTALINYQKIDAISN